MQVYFPIFLANVKKNVYLCALSCVQSQIPTPKNGRRITKKDDMKKLIFTTLTLLLAVAMQAQDESSYNDTTSLDIAAYVTQWNATHPSDRWPEIEAEEVRFAVDNKTVVIKQNPDGDPLGVEEDYVDLVVGNTMTITAPYKIRKIIFSFTDYNGRRWALFQGAQTTCSNGALTNDKSDQTTAFWTGNTPKLTITTGSYHAKLTKMVIICDSTDNKATVTFYNYDGSVLKTEQVPLGQSAHAPTIEDPCFTGWDKDFTTILEDTEVHPLKADLLFFTLDRRASCRERVFLTV